MKTTTTRAPRRSRIDDEQPIPWLTRRWDDALTTRPPLNLTPEAGDRIIETLSQIVSGLHDDEKPYTVRFGGTGASTDLSNRVVHVGQAPFLDKALTRGQRAAIATGLAVHEVGHIRHTRKVLDAINAFPGEQLAQKVQNLVDDIRAEALMRRDFPGVGNTLDHTMVWVAALAGQELVPLSARSGFMRAVAITRYPGNVAWDPTDADEVAERAWWDAWAIRCLDAHTAPAQVVVIREALDRIKADGHKGDEPGKEGGEGQEGGEGGDPGSEKGEGEGEGEGEPVEGEQPKTGSFTRRDLDASNSTSDEPVPDLPTCPVAAIVNNTTDNALQIGIDAINREGLDPSTGNRVYSYPGGRITVARVRPTDTTMSTVRSRIANTGRYGFVTPVNVGQETVDIYGVLPIMRPDVHQTIARSIQAAKRGDPRPETGQRRGVLDRQRLSRVAVGDYRIFQSPIIPGPERIRVTVLLDASSSMGGAVTGSILTRKAVTAQAALDLAGGLALMPNVEAAVYAHNKNRRGPTIHDLWHTGEPVEQVAAYAGLRFDVNYDSWAIRYAADDMVDARRPGEACVLIVLSDGETDIAAARASVEGAYRQDIRVLSIAIGSDVSRASQDAIYGRDNVIESSDNPVVFTRNIAEAIGRVI